MSENNREQYKDKYNSGQYKCFLIKCFCYTITKNLWLFEANIATKKDYSHFNFLPIQPRFDPKVAVLSTSPTMFSRVYMILPWKLVSICQRDFQEEFKKFVILAEHNWKLFIIQEDKYTMYPGQSNLSQQQQQNFWSKLIVEQKNQKMYNHA